MRKIIVSVFCAEEIKTFVAVIDVSAVDVDALAVIDVDVVVFNVF